VKDDPDERPTMGEVEVELEHALSLQEQADIRNTYGHYTLLSETIIDRSTLPIIIGVCSQGRRYHRRQ